MRVGIRAGFILRSSTQIVIDLLHCGRELEIRKIRTNIRMIFFVFRLLVFVGNKGNLISINSGQSIFLLKVRERASPFIIISSLTGKGENLFSVLEIF